MELIAVRDGFYDGARVRRGQAFEFDEKRFKAPRWAKPRAEARVAIEEQDAKERLRGGETKPQKAIAAAVKRAGSAVTE